MKTVFVASGVVTADVAAGVDMNGVVAGGVVVGGAVVGGVVVGFAVVGGVVMGGVVVGGVTGSGVVVIGRSPVILMSSIPKPSSPAFAESDNCSASVLPRPAMAALNTVALLVR